MRQEAVLDPYVDVETGQPIGPEFGRCDHERQCGYDNRPTGNDLGNKSLWVSGNKCYKAFRPGTELNLANCISQKVWMKTITCSGSNKLFLFLSHLWGEDRVCEVFRRYNVGTMDLWNWYGCAVFWQIDQNFVCRTGKIMEYGIKIDESGREIDVNRVKEQLEDGSERPHVMFYHSLGAQDFLFRQCLFGEHLLSQYPNKIVNLVESEKTAIICTINKPDELFLATGGIQNLRQETIGVLRNRKTVVFPDKGSAYDVWCEKVKNVMYGYNVKVSNYLQDNEEIEDGKDIADLVIKRKVYGRKNG